MTDLKGKVAFITGGASGIGLALARVCGVQGMKVFLADIDRSALDEAVASLADEGIVVAAAVCDVSDIDSLRSVAQETISRFGKVHLLVNNAGVLAVGGAGETSVDTWRRTLDINVLGVVYGVEVFLPLIREHGEGGHILNTASVGGHVGYAGVLAYNTTKFAVVGYTESLADQLREENIGVSMLCPGFTNTRIAQMQRYGDSEAGNDGADSAFGQAVQAGMSAAVVAGFTIEQVQRDALYIFTHPGTRGEVEERFPQISAAFDVTDASELVNSDPDARRQAQKDEISKLYR